MKARASAAKGAEGQCHRCRRLRRLRRLHPQRFGRPRRWKEGVLLAARARREAMRPTRVASRRRKTTSTCRRLRTLRRPSGCQLRGWSSEMRASHRGREGALSTVQDPIDALDDDDERVTHRASHMAGRAAARATTAACLPAAALAAARAALRTDASAVCPTDRPRLCSSRRRHLAASPLARLPSTDVLTGSACAWRSSPVTASTAPRRVATASPSPSASSSGQLLTTIGRQSDDSPASPLVIRLRRDFGIGRRRGLAARPARVAGRRGSASLCRWAHVHLVFADRATINLAVDGVALLIGFFGCRPPAVTAAARAARAAGRRPPWTPGVGWRLPLRRARSRRPIGTRWPKHAAAGRRKARRRPLLRLHQRPEDLSPPAPPPSPRPPPYTVARTAPPAPPPLDVHRHLRLPLLPRADAPPLPPHAGPHRGRRARTPLRHQLGPRRPRRLPVQLQQQRIHLLL